MMRTFLVVAFVAWGGGAAAATTTWDGWTPDQQAILELFVSYLQSLMAPDAFTSAFGAALSGIGYPGFVEPAAGSSTFVSTISYEPAEVVPTPIPATLPLLAGAVGGLALWRRRRARRG